MLSLYAAYGRLQVVQKTNTRKYNTFKPWNMGRIRFLSVMSSCEVANGIELEIK